MKLVNNLKNYYSNNKLSVLSILGLLSSVFIISLLIINLAPITNCAGITIEYSIEIFIMIYIGVAALLIFFILFAVLLKLIEYKIQQDKEENKITRDIPWFNIIFTLLVFLFTILFPLYQLYSGKIIICGSIPEITLTLYLIALSIYIVVFALLVLFIVFIEKLLVSVYNIIKKNTKK